jgi:hypothetical protein
MIENDRGQYLKIGNWIQRMKRRECIIRRHVSESRMDDYVRHVEETKTSPTINQDTKSALEETKNALLREKGVRVRDALEIINRRLKEEPANVRPTIDL